MIERLAELIREHRALYEATRPTIGRWVYCKCCGKNTRPAVSSDYSVVICTECGYGLAPMREVCAAGSYAAWRESLAAK